MNLEKCVITKREIQIIVKFNQQFLRNFASLFHKVLHLFQILEHLGREQQFHKLKRSVIHPKSSQTVYRPIAMRNVLSTWLESRVRKEPQDLCKVMDNQLIWFRFLHRFIQQQRSDMLRRNALHIRYQQTIPNTSRYLWTRRSWSFSFCSWKVSSYIVFGTSGTSSFSVTIDRARSTLFAGFRSKLSIRFARSSCRFSGRTWLLK